ncbi:hypothetical protein [Metabacillus fastidiosus]|uniref:Uncharacterized protein n=1 Tax=Metabacillus fastidiosus TaxID=1458 RepID=A0ABU6P3W4_9BACI|nr:hypothetical protein [Metabacillus fastidiosus]
MARDIINHIETKYINAQGQEIEITYVEITYHTPNDDYNHSITLPIEKANDFANTNGIRNPYVSAAYDKEEAIELSL